jgi:hypothetical protein
MAMISSTVLHVYPAGDFEIRNVVRDFSMRRENDVSSSLSWWVLISVCSTKYYAEDCLIV